MNILLVSYDYPPYRGGIANVSYQMAYQLDRMDERVVVIAQRTKGDREFDKCNKFLTYRCINIFFLRELALILSLPYLVLRYKIDIIYVLIWCQGGFAAFLTSRFLNIPYILHTYGLELIDYKKMLFDRIKYGLFRENYKRLIFKNAKRIITISNYTKDMVIRAGARESQVDIVYCGVDINRFRPNLETSEIASRHKLEGKKILLTVSRLNLYKGHDIVIKLMPQLLQKIPNIIYLIVGSGKSRDCLALLVKKLNLDNNVIFAGYVEESKLPLYYNVCDIYIMLSKERLDRAEFEGFGLTFLEANSCCKPVIGAKTGGIGNAVSDGRTGYLVDPNNDREIIDKITLLLENKQLSKLLGEEGRRRIIKEGLVWDVISKRIRDILALAIRKSM